MESARFELARRYEDGKETTKIENQYNFEHTVDFQIIRILILNYNFIVRIRIRVKIQKYSIGILQVSLIPIVVKFAHRKNHKERIVLFKKTL